MIYLLGDSHATELYVAWSDKFPNLIWKTFGGQGFQNLVRDNNHFMSISRDVIFQKLYEIEKNSTIFFSYTDVDGRLGMAPKCKTILEDYEICVEKLQEATHFRKLIILDWYSICPHGAPDQNVSSSVRVETRDAQIAAFDFLKNKFPIEICTTRKNQEYENEKGFALPGVMKDDRVHYDFNNPLHIKYLLPVFQKLYNENK